MCCLRQKDLRLIPSSNLFNRRKFSKNHFVSIFSWGELFFFSCVLESSKNTKIAANGSKSSPFFCFMLDGSLLLCKSISSSTHLYRAFNRGRSNFSSEKYFPCSGHTGLLPTSVRPPIPEFD